MKSNETTMRLHVRSAYPESSENFGVTSIRRDLQAGLALPFAKWEEDFIHADAILFIEHHPPDDPLFLSVFLDPAFVMCASKCFFYNDSDYVFPVIPGIYPSLEFMPIVNGRILTSPYFFQICENNFISESLDHQELPYLYSFAGAIRTHGCRSGILELRADTRAKIIDTSARNAWQLMASDLVFYQKNFADLLRDSHFVICPRGHSPCSYRLTETMKAGRVPVIVSDNWTLPNWLPWDEFSIRVAESDVSKIPDLLREREGEAPDLGRRAREVWQEHLAPDTRCITFVRLLTSLADDSLSNTSPLRAIFQTLIFASQHRIGRSLIRQYIKRLFKFRTQPSHRKV